MNHATMWVAAVFQCASCTSNARLTHQRSRRSKTRHSISSALLKWMCVTLLSRCSSMNCVLETRLNPGIKRTRLHLLNAAKTVGSEWEIWEIEPESSIVCDICSFRRQWAAAHIVKCVSREPLSQHSKQDLKEEAKCVHASSRSYCESFWAIAHFLSFASLVQHSGCEFFFKAQGYWKPRCLECRDLRGHS